MNNTQLIASSELTLVLGLGKTGLSVARYFQKHHANRKVVLMDTRTTLDNQASIEEVFNDYALILGLDESIILSASTIVISPGIDPRIDVLKKAQEQGIRIIGDIELFAQHTKTPVVAITGSNGKTTVTTLVGQLFEAAGLQVAVGGNIGTPVLDLLEEPKPDYYVLELSSFQLEATYSLSPVAACVLNVTDDHLDRYDSFAHYHQAKMRIVRYAKAVVTHRHDPLTAPPKAQGVHYFSVGLDKPDRYGLGIENEYILDEFTSIMSLDTLSIKGKHNQLNALFALALCKAIGISLNKVLPALQQFRGLAHRCETIAVINQVSYINDSKATNVGATLAALQGLANGQKKIILIAGGQSKQADFSPLQSIFEQHVKCLIVIGTAANELAVLMDDPTCTIHADTLEQAVFQAQAHAGPGDIVLLSPACASFDMFRSFEHRGECFRQAVEGLAA